MYQYTERFTKQAYTFGRYNYLKILLIGINPSIFIIYKNSLNIINIRSTVKFVLFFYKIIFKNYYYYTHFEKKLLNQILN